MKATPSAACRTNLRVASCMTWPGTVKSFNRIFSPASESIEIGSMSKKSVRSFCVSSVIRSPQVFDVANQ
jgi:hypothetical protein